MIKNSGYNALIRLERNGSKVAFDATSGVPVVAYSCPICGYIELYSAQKTSSWQDDSASSDSDNRLPSLEFEQIAIDALLRSTYIPAGTVTERRVPIIAEGLMREVDAILFTPETIFIIEIKAKYSRLELRNAASKLTQAVYLYRNSNRGVTNASPIIPLLIIPSIFKADNIVDGVPVLKLDTYNQLFTNENAIFELINNQNPDILRA